MEIVEVGEVFVRNSPSATIPDCNYVKSIIISPVDDLEDKHDAQSLIQLKEIVKNKLLLIPSKKHPNMF